MFLPLPFGMETSKNLDYFEIEVGRFLKNLSKDNHDYLNKVDARAWNTRLSLMDLFIHRAHEAGKQLESELPSELPRFIRAFISFSTLMMAFECWFEVCSSKREICDNGRACYSVEVRLQDKHGLFPSVSKRSLGTGLPFLPGDVEPKDTNRELGGFFSAYLMAASDLVESAFLLGEGFRR